MTPDYNYGLVTKHRWLWPAIDLSIVLLVTVSQSIQRQVTRGATRCTAAHCCHYYWQLK
jgi:hypothetical protein